MPDRAVVDRRSPALLGAALEITDRYQGPVGVGSYVRKDMQEIARYIRAALQPQTIEPSSAVVGEGVQWVKCSACGAERLKPVEPQPRALVALSDDGQWLVTKAPDSTWNPSYQPRFAVLEWRGVEWRLLRWVDDTGQDANEVLATFLEGQKEQDREVD